MLGSPDVSPMIHQIGLLLLRQIPCDSNTMCDMHRQQSTPCSMMRMAAAADCLLAGNTCTIVMLVGLQLALASCF